MKRRDDEMARLRRRHGDLDRLIITHLTYQNDIRRLTKGCPESGDIAVRVRHDLSLGYHALLMTVQILDRVLQRNDVGVSRMIDLVNDTRQRRALTAAGRSRDQDEALGQLGDIDDILWYVKRLIIGQIERKPPG